MKKSFPWSAAVLGVVLLLGAVSLSARSRGTQTLDRATARSSSVVPDVPPQVLAPWANAIYSDWDDKDKDKDKDGDGDNDKDDHKHKHRHDATPEPSTLLSFGAAILIGGGVLYSRRLRKSK